MNIPRRWTFRSDEVAKNFDAHVKEQLPWYTLATEAVAIVASNYVPSGGLVYDVGASTGNVGRAIEAILKERGATLIPIEESREMAAKYQGPGQVLVQSAQATKWEPFDLGILFLTLMFVPVNDMWRLIESMLAAMKPGGALIIVDKVVPPAGYVGTVLRRLTMEWKLRNGASAAAVVRKDLSLSGVQRPLAPGDLPAGAIEFLRFGEFAAWIIESTPPAAGRVSVG